MAKVDLSIGAGDYAPVADRIALFYERFPEGRIITELRLLAAAECEGMRAARVQDIRSRLSEGALPWSLVERIERRLTRWLALARERRLGAKSPAPAAPSMAEPGPDRASHGPPGRTPEGG
jgi:hypothetical protein